MVAGLGVCGLVTGCGYLWQSGVGSKGVRADIQPRASEAADVHVLDHPGQELTGFPGPAGRGAVQRVADPVELSLVVPGFISVGAPRDGGCLGAAEAAERLDDALGSAGALLERRRGPGPRYRWCCPFFLEDHLQALQHGVILPRVAGLAGGTPVRSSCLRRHADDNVVYLVHALPAHIQHLVERGAGVRIDATTTRAGEPRDPARPHGWYGLPIQMPSPSAGQPAVRRGQR